MHLGDERIIFFFGHYFLKRLSIECCDELRSFAVESLKHILLDSRFLLCKLLEACCNLVLCFFPNSSCTRLCSYFRFCDYLLPFLVSILNYFPFLFICMRKRKLGFFCLIEPPLDYLVTCVDRLSKFLKVELVKKEEDDQVPF